MVGITLGLIFTKMVLNRAQGLKEKVMKFQREKITTSWDITKNVEGADSAPGPFRVNHRLIKLFFVTGLTKWELLQPPP